MMAASIGGAQLIAAATQCMSTHGWTTQKKNNGVGNGHANSAFTQKPVTERERLYAQATLEGCADELAAAPSGARNDTLYKKAFRIGTMTACGWIDRADVEAALIAAAATCGLNADDGEEATRKTIEFWSR